MIFTQEQINEIKQRLSLSGIKDSELDKLDLLKHPLTGKEVITIVKDGENLRISVEDLYEEFAKYIEQSENKEDFFNVSVYLGRLDPEFENAAKPCTLEEAINACPSYIRRAGQTISFLDSLNMKWETYQYIGTEDDDWMDITLFVNHHQVLQDKIDAIPDYEDLTQNEGGQLKFADKTYNAATYTGLGRKYLRKNIVSGVNTLTQDMLADANTIYHIQYDYTLGENITVPKNCILEFDGGSIRNGKINIDNCKKINNLKAYNVEIYGFNTALTDNTINILDVCGNYITYSNGKYYGLANAINTFLNNLKSPETLSGITIKVPSGIFVIEETIYIPIGVSLIGCSGTEFVLDFTHNENNDTVGVMIDYHYMSPPSFNNSNAHYFYSSYRDCVKNLCIRTEVANNNYEGIHDNHATHNIECIRFDGLYRYLMCTENYTGRLRYYGDSRTIKNLYCSNNTKNTFKIYIANGDAQSLDKVLGYVGIVIIGAHITISNCISTELVLINVNAVVNGLHCEQEPCMVYNSNITFNNCLFGSILQYNAVELNRTKYFNCLEIDTNRIIQRVLDDNIVTGYEGGVNPNPGDKLHYSSSASNIVINNSRFIGLGYAFDTAPKSDIDNEYYYIYATNQCKIILNNSYCRFDYNGSPNGPRLYPRITRTLGHPEGIACGESINNINTVPTLSVTKEISTFGSGMAAGTYYYKVGIAQDVYRGIGSINNNEVSITIADGECVKLQLTNMSAEDLSNQSIIIWRGTTSNTYTKMCILQIQKDTRWHTTTENYSTRTTILSLGYDSLTHLCGFKWINNVRNTLTKCSKITKIEGNNYIIDFGNDMEGFYLSLENGDIVIDNNKKFIYDSSLDSGTSLLNNLRYVGGILKKNLPSLKNWNMHKGIPFYDETITPNRVIYWNGTHWITSDGTVAKWNVTVGSRHIASFSNTGPANAGEQYSTTITAEPGYTLASVKVLINNEELTVNTDYTLDLNTGELIILGVGGTGGITGDLRINASAN